MPKHTDSDLLEHLKEFPKLQKLATPTFSAWLTKNPYASWAAGVEDVDQQKRDLGARFSRVVANSLHDGATTPILHFIERAVDAFVPNPSRPPRGLVAGITSEESKKAGARNSKFFDTVSELALALALSDAGFCVRLAVPFFCGEHGVVDPDSTALCTCAKDVDILAAKDGKRYFIDVLTLNLREGEMATTFDGFGVLELGAGLDFKATVSKAVDKYRSKFKAAIEGGWKERAVVALNLGLDNRFATARLLMGATGADDPWRETAAREFNSRCPQAEVLYFDFNWWMSGACFTKPEDDLITFRQSARRTAP